MKIVILTVDHIYANKVVKDLIRNYRNQIKLVVESDTLLPKRNKINALLRYLNISGFYYVFAQATKLEIYKSLSFISGIFGLRNSKFYSYKKLAKLLKIKIVTTKNVNDHDFIKAIKTISPDIIVSVFFNQIVSLELINIPRKGIINVHPAYLPDYKGVSPVFWALANSAKFSGITVHYIDQGIDTGRIIERKKVRIKKDDNEHSLYWRICELGSRMLISTIQEVQKKDAGKFPNKGGRYFSLPTKAAVKKYKRSKPFFVLRDYIFGQDTYDSCKKEEDI